MADYNREQLVAALRKADAAGDTAAARAIAKRIKGMESPQPAPKTMEELTPGISTNPTDGVSGVSLFAAGGGKSLRDTGLGIVQALSEGGPMASGPLAVMKGLGVPMPRNPVKEWADSRIAQNKQADAALTDTGAGLGGNITGTVAQILLPGATVAGASRVPQLAGQAKTLASVTRAFMPTSIQGGAAQGAVLGSLQPVEEGDSRALNAGTGAAGGTLGGLLPRIAGASLRGLNRIREPLTARGLENIAGRTLQRFANNPQLQQLSDPILGRAPTLAEATLDPGIAQLQRAAQSKSPEVASAVFNARVNANDARVAALERFAGTPAQRQTLMEAIEKAEKAAYAKVNTAQGVDVNPVVGQIDSILAGPQGKRNAVRSALTEAREALFKADGSPETSADMLLGARGAIKDLIEGKGDKQAGRLAQRELIQVRDALDAAIRRVAPEIDTALDARRLGMRPINEMDTMADLLQRASVPVAKQDGSLARGIQPSAFLRPTEDLDALAQRGTGFRKAQGDDVLSGPAQDTIEGIRIGLARQQAADNIAKVPGSPTAQFLAGQNIMEGILGQPRQGSFMSGLANLGAAALDKPYAFVGVPERLNSVMARILTDPGEAQRVLAKLPPPDRALIEQAIGRLSAPAGSATAAGQNR